MSSGRNNAARRQAGGQMSGGFTLIELVIVILIIAMLAAILIPSFAAMRWRNELSACALNLKTIGTALGMYREDWMGFPLDRLELAGKMYEGKDIGGPGLFYLYYLYGNPEAGKSAAQVKGWSNVRADYMVRRFEGLHCPASPVDRPRFKVADYPVPDPLLGGYNNYDLYYRRDWGRLVSWPNQGNRKLTTAFPADETVVTWCPYHRAAPPPEPLGDMLPQPGRVAPGDIDLVLFVDGAVEKVKVGPADDGGFDPDTGAPAKAQDTREYRARHIF